MKKRIVIDEPEIVEADGANARAEAESAQSESLGEAAEAGIKPPGAGQAAAEPVEETARLRQQVAELTDKHLRAVAEQQNYIRRATAERAELIRYACADVVRDLLPVVDDLERTLLHFQPTTTDGEAEASSLVNGVKLIHDNLLAILAKHNVVRIEAKGVPFDPRKHEALMRQPSKEHVPGTVLQECQAGYTMWDRVLRPAKVIVSAEPAEPSRQPAGPVAEVTGDNE